MREGKGSGKQEGRRGAGGEPGGVVCEVEALALREVVEEELLCEKRWLREQRRVGKWRRNSAVVEGVVGGSAGASGVVVEAVRALPGPLRDFSQDQRQWRNWLGGIVVVVVDVAAAAETGVAAGAAAAVVSRRGIASDSERKWEMYRIQRAKVAGINTHTGQRVQQNFFTRAQCALSTLSPTRAYL